MSVMRTDLMYKWQGRCDTSLPKCHYIRYGGYHDIIFDIKFLSSQDHGTSKMSISYSEYFIGT